MNLPAAAGTTQRAVSDAEWRGDDRRRRGGARHCRNDDDDGYRRGHHRGGYDAAGGEGAVALLGGRSRVCVDFG